MRSARSAQALRHTESQYNILRRKKQIQAQKESWFIGKEALKYLKRSDF